MAENRQLFDYGSVKTHPSRSGFDLFARTLFTAKAGELLPVYWRLVYPGDKFNIEQQHITRTVPVQTAAYTRLREYLDWYFVPLRLINKNLLPALVEMNDNPIQAQSLIANRDITPDIPHCPSGGSISSLKYAVAGASIDAAPVSGANNILNIFGFKQSANTYKLLSYLRYGNFWNEAGSTPITGIGISDSDSFSPGSFVNVDVNILPLAAYQKIYADWWRDSQWEKNEPYTYNFDWYSGGNVLASLSTALLWKAYLSKNNLFTLRYCNWKKDMFMGCLPTPQMGDVATVAVGGSIESVLPVNLYSAGSTESKGPVKASSTGAGQLTVSTDSRTPSGDYNLGARNPGALSNTFNIIQLRLAEASQKWKEVSQCADKDYRSQIKAHFDVTLSAALSDQCRYLGGQGFDIEINPQVNTNLSGEEKATIKATGYGSGVNQLRFEADDEGYGILMCIYHAEPILDYVITGQPQELLYTACTDLPKPEFDSIGMQSLPWLNFVNSKKVLTGWESLFESRIMGYVPRFVELKTDVDQVFGAFLTTKKDMVAPLDPAYLSSWFKQFGSTNPLTPYELNYAFFKCNPAVLDNIFGVAVDSTWDTDQFEIQLYNKVTAVRSFDYNGMPY